MWWFIFLVGLAVGSFLNVYIWRMQPSPSPLPRGEGARRAGEGAKVSVWRGRSYCPKCRKTLQWYELVPLLSFAIQRGRCRGCQQKIDWQYPLVELATGVLFTLVYMNLGIPREILHFTFYILHFYLLSVLVILFVYDLRYGLVPDRVVLPAIAVAALYTVILNAVKDPVLLSTGFLASLGMTVVGVIVGAAFFWIQYVISKGRWLGTGDIRIGALMGAMLGWPGVLQALVVSYILGGLVGIGLVAAGRKQFGQTVPLGTFLTLGTAIVFLYGEQIWKMYWRI